jgi:hypothetical protein
MFYEISYVDIYRQLEYNEITIKDDIYYSLEGDFHGNEPCTEKWL